MGITCRHKGFRVLRQAGCAAAGQAKRKRPAWQAAQGRNTGL